MLIVDDDPSMRRLVSSLLEAHGYGAPEHAATGRDAIERAAAADVILLDHHLPDMSGIAVLEAMRARGLDASVVLMTAHGNESLAARALRNGADDYLAKDAALTEMLPEVLERVRRLRGLRTALASAERDVVRVERLAAIGEVTVTIHHEINNPLMAAFAELALLRTTELTDMQATSAENIGAALERIRDIVSRLRDLRRADTTAYVDGVRMVELPGGGETIGTAVPPRGAALLLIPDTELARVTTLLLRGSGFTTERVDDVATLQQNAATVGVSLVVIACEPDEAGGDPLAGFRPAPGRSYSLLALVRDAGDAARAAGADRVMVLPYDAATFAADVVALVGRR